jgi:peptidoglycan hydrolase-like protein with peptidoglycan-binding domain
MPNIFERSLHVLDAAGMPTAAEHLGDLLSHSLTAMGLVTAAAAPQTFTDAIRAFQKLRKLPATGVLGHDDALEFAAALREQGLPDQGFTAVVRSNDPEAFGHDIDWPIVKKGANSTAVRLIQLRLNDLGFGPLGVDGDFGDHTDTAVRHAQQAKGLSVDGVVGKDSWHALVGGMAVLHQGDTGEAVHTAQLRLIELGYASFTPTQFFGPKTLEALHSFQTEAGLPPSDAVDETTWRYLFGTTFGPGDDVVAMKHDLTARVASHIGAVPAASQAAVSSVMAAAITCYGIREQPEGSNRGPEVDALVGTRGWAWCALAVSAWLKRGLSAASWSGIPFHKEMASANGIRAWGVDGGRFIPAVSVPPGACFVMNRGTTTPTPPTEPFSIGHTGFVVEDRGSAVLTIEGNSHDSVRSVERDKSTMVGFISWWG